MNPIVEKMVRAALLKFDYIDLNVETKTGKCDTYRVTSHFSGVHIQSMYDEYRSGKSDTRGLKLLSKALKGKRISSVYIGRN